MQHIISKLSIMASSLALALYLFDITDCVTAFLIATTASGMSRFLDSRNAMYLITALVCLAIVPFPALGIFLPVFAYDCGILNISPREKYPACGVLLTAWLLACRHMDLRLCCVTGMFSLSAGLSAHILSVTEDLKYTIRRNRDSSRELQLLLEQKHASLLEKSQYEIEAATLRERNRIAREIHDNVGHLLTSSILQVGALNTINKSETLAPHFEQLSQTLNQAMDTIRSSVHNLHQTELDLQSSLNTYLASVEGMDIHLQYDVQYMSREMACHFLAIIKEAVFNTTKHSNADRIEISILEHPAFYRLQIEDNGTLPKGIQTKPGMGLSSMQERVQMMHGTMEIFHEHGFRIFITVMKESV